MPLPRAVMAAVWLLVAVPAAAEAVLETITLRHRSAEQVIPALRLLLEPGATLSGHGGRLMVRASAANIAELRHVLAAIDRPLRRLQISVRFEETADAQDAGITASARIGAEGSHVEFAARDSRANRAADVAQRLEVLEGSAARIMAGTRVPLAGGAPHETGTGFAVVPRLAGERILIEVLAARASESEEQRLVTTVSARLGEWFQVGAPAADAASEAPVTAGAKRPPARQARRVWLKVEELR